jgi:hypothetical protein
MRDRRERRRPDPDLSPSSSHPILQSPPNARGQDLVQRLNKARLWSLDHLASTPKIPPNYEASRGRAVERLHGAANQSDRD